jgi:hypothetical protein
MSPEEEVKTYWRVYAAMQELLRVTDSDVSKNSDLSALIHSVCRVARLYRIHGADAILQAKLRLPVDKPHLNVVIPFPKKPEGV